MSEKNLTPKAREALRHIRNAVMHTGRTPSVRELMRAMEYRSPRSASLLIDELIENGFLKKRSTGDVKMIKDLSTKVADHTVEVPLVGTVACGAPILAEENIEAYYPVSVKLAKSGSKHFLLRASGDSMDRAGINDGDWLLIRQQTSAETGDRVVALIDDEATVKEFNWSPGSAVILKPKSTNPAHRPLILDHDFQILGVVVAVLPNLDTEEN